MLKLFLYLAAAATVCMSEETWHFHDHEFDRTRLGDSVDKASMKILKEAYSVADDKNLITSPMGVLELLSMYSGGSGEGIREEITRALGVSNYDELYRSYTSLSERFSTSDANHLTLANKIYVDQQNELVDEFSTKVVPAYHSEIEKANFKDVPSVIAAINRWSDEKTKGHIKKPVSENDIVGDAVAVLVNVIFFQGQWHVPFNASETKEANFHVDKDNTVKKPMMHLEQTLFYHESSELDARMVELPYKQKGFRMVVVLPNKVDGLPSLLEKVATKGLLSDVFSLAPAGRDIILDMPKFEFQSGLDLNVILPKVGVSKIFTESTTGIVRGAPVVVSKAFQKAVIKVDEEGATAGAFTGFVIIPASSLSQPPPPMEFKADHPFLFAILHEDILLFAGTFTH